MQKNRQSREAGSIQGEQWAEDTVVVVKRTAETAPLSLARVKISSMSEASVELLSQETRAIQGVMAVMGAISKGRRRVAKSGSAYWSHS